MKNSKSGYKNDGQNNSILAIYYTKEYEGEVFMKTDCTKRLCKVGKFLDEHLTSLDRLRCKLELEEQVVLDLLKEERLLKEKLNIRN